MLSYSGDYINFHDSFGCGKSIRWEYEAFSLIQKNGENCGHISIDNIIIKIKKPEKERIALTQCKVKCPFCKNHFPQTSKKLTEEYLRFYNRNSEKQMPISGNAQPFNRQQPKPYKKNKQAHVANTKYGMGDYYGQAIKNPVGKMRDSSVGIIPLSKKKMKTPPKSLA